MNVELEQWCDVRGPAKEASDEASFGKTATKIAQQTGVSR